MPAIFSAPTNAFATRVDARRRSLVVTALGAVGGAALWAPPSRAAAFPTRPVRIVVPYSVGVGPDVVARSVAERLARVWGQTVLVDNKPGASGIVAFSEVRRTPADGHTLFLADTATLAVNPLLHASLPYDPQQDLTALTMLFRATFLFWVGGSSPIRSIAGLLDAARAAPGRISYATLGNGHAMHLAIETFARSADIRMLHVPFKDGGAMLSAVASGDVDLTTLSLNTVAGLMASGRLRPLAVAARRRLPDLPDVPTLVEAGGPAVEMHPWAALMTVAHTPAAIVDQLRQDLGAVLADPTVRSRAALAGFEITPSTPRAVSERVDADVALYAPLIREGRVAQL
ncbi:MAG: tripartite tricarboxylate transporter substrate-binding protein [Caldimonas sp.]